jgi:hypothetical protein
MTLNYEKLMALGTTDVPYSYDDSDSLLYALGVGFGSDPLDEKELPYVVETIGRCTVPTMATTLSSVNILQDCGRHYAQVLHGEQKLELYRPLPMAAELLTNSRVESVHDRGAGRGAVIRVATEGRLKRDDTAGAVDVITQLGKAM